MGRHLATDCASYASTARSYHHHIDKLWIEEAVIAAEVTTEEEAMDLEEDEEARVREEAVALQEAREAVAVIKTEAASEGATVVGIKTGVVSEGATVDVVETEEEAEVALLEKQEGE